MAVATPLGILFLVFLLQVKHFICDGPLQTTSMIADKSVYGKKMGLAHAGLHGLGSLVVLPIAGLSLGSAVIFALADCVTHYHVDYFKENFVKSRGWTPKDTFFWWSLAVDQAMHHFFYLAVAAVVVLRA